MTLLVDKLTVRIPIAGGHDVHAVTEATLVAEAGRAHFVIGSSGSGKSTLLSAVSGLLPDTARMRGVVVVRTKEAEVFAPDLWRMRGRVVGVVPQSAMTCFTPVRRLGPQIEETVRFLRGARGPEELLGLVDLEPDALRRYPHELSGGMLQRAAVACALAGDPPAVVADEPTASLDGDRSAAILRLLSGLARTGDRTVLVTTHDIDAVGHAANDAEISVMCASRIIETGPAQRVLAAPREEYTRDLLAALPQNGLRPLPHPMPSLVDLDDDYRYGDEL